MGILINKTTKTIVQGITGNQGSFHTKLMMDYGTEIVAGVTPGKEGTEVYGIPVYDTFSEALDHTDANASICFVPARAAKDALMEAIDFGINLIVIITDGVPVHDSMKVVRCALDRGIKIIGPNSPGIITVNECKLGIMPIGIFNKGNVGIASRSGTLTYEIISNITAAGYGQTTCIGLGGDPITGLTFTEVLESFNNDSQTEIIVIVGEIGGNAEEEAADYIKESVKKPVIAYIAGRTAPPGKRMGHAGAIISRGQGTAKSKINALKSANVYIADFPKDIPRILKNIDKKDDSIKT